MTKNCDLKAQDKSLSYIEEEFHFVLKSPRWICNLLHTSQLKNYGFSHIQDLSHVARKPVFGVSDQV